MEKLTDKQKEAFKDYVSELRANEVRGRGWTKTFHKRISKHLIELGFTREEVEEDDGALYFS